MSNDAESFFKEVDESVRQDRVLAMGKRIAPFAIGVFVAVLIGGGATEFWRAHTTQEAEQQSTAFSAAQEKAQAGDLTAASAQLETLSHQGPETYRVLAMMTHAATLEAKGDMPGAIAGFDAAASAAHDPLLRDTARLRAAYIVADTQDFQALRTRLAPLMQGTGQLSYLAKELFAVKAWEAGQNDLARSTLQNLQYAFGAPESVRSRAQLELAVVGPAPAGTTPAPAAPAATPAQHGETK